MDHTAPQGSILGTDFPVGHINVDACEGLSHQVIVFRSRSHHIRAVSSTSMLASLERVLPTVASHSQRCVARDTYFAVQAGACRLSFGADGKTKVVASSRKVIHALLHFRFSVAVEGAVIRKEELSQCGYLRLSLCFESSEVEHSSICSVLQLDAIIIIL